MARLKVQDGLSRFLGTPVQVRRLTFSARRMTLHGVSFQLPVSAPLRIEKLRLEGSLGSVITGRIFSGPLGQVHSVTLTGLHLIVAGVPLHAEGKVFLRGRPGAYAQVDGKLTLDHPLLRGEVEVTGTLLEPVVFGWLESAQAGRRHFISKWEINRKAINLSQMQIQGGWSAAGNLAFRQPSWKGELTVAAPDQRFRFQVMPGESGATRVVLWAQREGAPPKEFSARWIVEKGQVRFHAGLLDDQALLDGETDLKFPYRISVTMEANGLELADLADWIPGQSSSSLTGKVRAHIEASGILGRIASRGELVSGQGRFGRLDFDQIAIRFQGQGPLLRVENSQMRRRGNAMLMEGTLDLRRIGRPDFFRLIRLTPAEGRGKLELGGFEIAPAEDNSGVEVSRSGANGQKTSVGLEYKMDTAIPQEPVAREGIKVQAAISGDQTLNLRLQKEEQVIAVEHRKKF